MNLKVLKKINFDYDFWLRTFRDELKYPVKEERLDVSYLQKQGVVPKEIGLKRAVRLYLDEYIELAILEVAHLSRSLCTRTARRWKEKRLIRPLLVFTDSKESYVVIVPGPGTEGMAKALGVSEVLYRTDVEAILSMQYTGDQESLKKAYDEDFLPYERVREEFFEKYRELYGKIVKAVEKIIEEPSSYAQRFLGRLMFLYFLQRKGWLKGDRQFINKIKNYRELNEIFDALNRKGGEVPFLNGSLFERESYLTEEVEEKLSKVMDPIFKEARAFFNQYNFTVNETSPLEVEVSLDPLLLGTVLENMLPEHERGEKGTFYTPVNEMGFMCRRAIAAWLGIEERVVETPDGRLVFVDGLEELFKKLRKRRSEKEARELREKLLSLKILDPAVGSGGFLVMMMQTILQLLQELDEIMGWSTDPELYKKRIIPNLYGFDVEPEAVEIARLRIWLSLVVDQREPEPLPNLDLNIIAIRDSLQVPKAVQTSLVEWLEDPEYKAFVKSLEDIKARYMNAHDPEEKAALRKVIEELQRKYGERLTRNNLLPIEFFMPSLADVIVMNPPYVRQEQIPKVKKEEYSSTYRLPKKSDLYAYFMARALTLLKPNGVAVMITSDKWLEVGYGREVQKLLKPHLLAVYGQRERSFGADVNTVITVVRKEELPDESSVQFVYLERYGERDVRNYKRIPRRKLEPGKWYYLRAPRVFEVLLPKLDKKLGDFAEVKFGIKTGANEFFYMKDITHLYEADYLANPKKFEKWGVKAKTTEELVKQGLIYIENEGGERFVIDRKDVCPIVRSPKEIQSYVIDSTNKLCLYTSSPGKFTRKYIEWGESKGFNQRPTCKSRKQWWKLSGFRRTNILLPMSWMDKIYIPYSKEPVMCDHRLYGVYFDETVDIYTAWLYLNSTLFYLTVELYCRRLGGGATDIMVEDYERIPVPNLKKIEVSINGKQLFKRKPLPYYEEIKQSDRRALDRMILDALGFPKNELDRLVDELHRAFVEVVEDRLIKAGRPLPKVKQKKRKEGE